MAPAADARGLSWCWRPAPGVPQAGGVGRHQRGDDRGKLLGLFGDLIQPVLDARQPPGEVLAVVGQQRAPHFAQTL